MQFRRASIVQFSLPIALFAGFMGLLWVAGGASRADALGQALVRVGAWAILLVTILGGVRPNFSQTRPVFIVLLLALSIPLIQLVPLPPSFLPQFFDRKYFPLTEMSMNWRPLTVTPSATLNALSSLTIPTVVFVLFAQLNRKERLSLVSVLFVFVIGAVFIGLLQLSGWSLSNPFINEIEGTVSSIFANRNHFALLIAMGCIILPVWAFAERKALRWRGPFAAIAILLFVLTAFAIGSRSGLLLVGLALVISTLLVGNRIKRRLYHSPPWVLPTVAVVALVVVTIFVSLSFFAGRVETIDRVFELTVGEDLRVRSQHTILEMISATMPLGSGAGSFDSLFRAFEPENLLALQYFNQAHNDFVGIVLDSGLPGLTLLASAIVWWSYATYRVVRAADCHEIMVARLGSALLLLTLVASATDYPARTPIIMAIIAIAGAWLAHGCHVCRCSTLPQRAPVV